MSQRRVSKGKGEGEEGTDGAGKKGGGDGDHGVKPIISSTCCATGRPYWMCCVATFNNYMYICIM